MIHDEIDKLNLDCGEVIAEPKLNPLKQDGSESKNLHRENYFPALH